MSTFHILGKPLTLVDMINRRAAATGSVGYARATADADYNGHSLALGWNDYRGYYVVHYYWGERVVIYRGTDFKAALIAAKKELSRQGRGATLFIAPKSEDVALAKADPDLTEGDMVEDTRSPDHWKFKFLGEAKVYRAEYLLINVATEADWHAGLEDLKQQRRGSR